MQYHVVIRENLIEFVLVQDIVHDLLIESLLFQKKHEFLLTIVQKSYQEFCDVEHLNYDQP